MKLKYKVEFILLVSIARFVGLFGLKNARYLAKPVAFLFYYLIPIRKTVVKKNLSLAFPNLNHHQINKLAFDNYYSIGISFIEIMAIKYSSRDDLTSMVIFDNPELINSVIKKNRGLILFTAHFGNWELGAIFAGMVLENTLYVLAKKQKNTLVAGLIKNVREKFGNKEILLGSSIRELYKTLKDKGNIGMVGDQRGPRDGARVNFFGRPTSIFTGTAAMALKINVPIVVALLGRRPDNKYYIFLEEISLTDLEGTTEEKEIEIIQRYMNILQKNIEKHPEQWFWMHDIWKY